MTSKSMNLFWSRLYFIAGAIMLGYVLYHLFVWIVLTIGGILLIKEGLRLQGWTLSRIMMNFMTRGRF